MTNPQIEIQLIAAVVAMACAIPGVFLVLRKMALISDAISHSILPGIVIGFFITQDLNSPLLILLAAFTGVITVVLVEYLQKTGLVKEDTAIGLVFPMLFSIGVILIAKNASDVHLDIDAVLLGELAFAPFDRVEIGGTDMGPKSLWVMGSILITIIMLLLLFFKELKVSTFDAGLAASMGISPVLMHYGLMSVSSITIVGAFDAVGAILVIALMIAPAAAAYLLTTDLKRMIGLSMFFGVLSAIAGYWFAHWLDASIAGSIATTLGLIFLLIYLFAPKKGLISVLYRQERQKIEVSLITFLIHLSRHEEESERHINHLQEHIDWHEVRAKKVLDLALKNNLIDIDNDIITLTEKGSLFTEKSLEYIFENRDEKIESMKENFFLFRG
jgi:manganese/zinc/iron transport system permease protein